MEIIKNNNNGDYVIQVIGRLDTNTAPSLEDELFLLRDIKTLTLDLGELVYLSSAGLRVLLNCYKEYGKNYYLKNVRDEVMEVLEMTGFADIMQFVKEGQDEESYSKVFPAEVNELNNVLAFIDALLEEHETPMKLMMPIDVSIEELFVNIASYAYGDDKGDAEIKVSFSGDDVAITLKDSGFEFDPTAKKDPDITASAEERGIGGLGIFMVKKYMDDVSYVRENGYNILTITKKIK